MNDFERCKNAAEELRKNGVPEDNLLEELLKKGYSSDAVQNTLYPPIDDTESAKLDNNSAVNSAKNYPQPELSLQQKIIGFIFKHYIISAIIGISILLIALFILIPKSIPYVIMFCISNLPKGIIFAVILKIFVGTIYSVENHNNSWLKALGLGLVFSFTTLGGAVFGAFSWMSISLMLLVIIPLMTFYDMEFKQTLPIVILSIILSFTYDVLLALIFISAFS